MNRTRKEQKKNDIGKCDDENANKNEEKRDQKCTLLRKITLKRILQHSKTYFSEISACHLLESREREKNIEKDNSCNRNIVKGVLLAPPHRNDNKFMQFSYT